MFAECWLMMKCRLSVATGNDVLVRYLLGALSLLCFESPRRNLSSVLLGGSAGPLEIGPPQTSDVAERAQGRAIIQVSLAYHESAETCKLAIKS